MKLYFEYQQPLSQNKGLLSLRPLKVPSILITLPSFFLSNIAKNQNAKLKKTLKALPSYGDFFFFKQAKNIIVLKIGSYLFIWCLAFYLSLRIGLQSVTFGL